jgi:tetratricopeptide (TPR) repeat protein
MAMGKSYQSKQSGTLWIYNPWLDLIVGCGAWSLPLLLIAYAVLASSVRTWSVLFYALAIFFNYPHYMATIYRAYHRAEDCEKYRIFTVHTTALVLITLVVSHFWVWLLPWIFTIYLTWSPWHYSGQNYGLFMMFARRAGANPDKRTRGALYGGFIVSYLVLFLGFHTGPSTDPLFVSIGIPAIVSRWEQIILLAAFAVLSFYGLSRLTRETGWRPLLPSFTLFSSQFLWFLLPAAISLLKHLDIPQSRYSNGVLAVMHSAQYLWITSYYARREATNDAEKTQRSWRPLAYFAALVAGGIALFIPGPWLASRAFHYDLTTSFLIFGALVNIHHFILDGAIWKLRDGRIASLLLNSKEKVEQAMVNASGPVTSRMRWLAGNTPGSRRLQVSAAVLLLTWGSVDQVHHYLSLRSEDMTSLQRAAVLDAFDSQLQMRLGRKEMESGNSEQAESAWRRAMQTSPSDPGPKQALLKFLLEQKRFDEALSLTETSLKSSPSDPNLLVNHGILSLQFDHPNQALEDWNQALKIDPNQNLAHLYLAHELDREGKAQEAATHYRAFLEQISRRDGRKKPVAPELIIGIVLRMADCQARSSQSDLALKSYQMAETLAAATKQPKLESVAAINEAELEAKAGKLDEALALYQKTLQLDSSNGDDSASAMDWFAYGRFLDESGFSERLAYACLLKAQAVARTTPKSPLPESAEKTTSRLEKQLGPAAVLVRRNPEPLVQEAIQLRR